MFLGGRNVVLHESDSGSTTGHSARVLDDVRTGPGRRGADRRRGAESRPPRYRVEGSLGEKPKGSSTSFPSFPSVKQEKHEGMLRAREPVSPTPVSVVPQHPPAHPCAPAPQVPVVPSAPLLQLQSICRVCARLRGVPCMLLPPASASSLGTAFAGFALFFFRVHPAVKVLLCIVADINIFVG